jgi:hypothetical protein
MSKWVNDDLFGKFQEQKKEEKVTPPGGGVRRLDTVWQTPEKGTDTVPKIYKGRFLVDQASQIRGDKPDTHQGLPFYKQYYYHMYRSGEKWVFTICPKTDDFENFCPFCSVTSKLYMGAAADKKMANNYKRKRKYVANFFVQDDPRDAERDDDSKVNGTVKLYEFPNKVESKLKEEITDIENGLGGLIFDPSDTGYSFILKVLSTKRDEKGNSWPDYSNSQFSRRPDGLGSDSDIDVIMDKTYDINEYLDKQRKTEEELIKLVKEEMLFDMISDEYDNLLRKRQVKAGEEGVELTASAEAEVVETRVRPIEEDQTEPDRNPVPETVQRVEEKEGEAPWNDSDSDEELLKELEGI